MKAKQPDGWERYHRQIISEDWGLEGQERLANARVLVVGAGGIGCPLLQYLVAAGVGQITVVDGDTVQLANLHRQILFHEEDVGAPKGSAAAQRLAGLNRLVRVTGIDAYLTPDNATELIGSVDIVLDGTDQFESRYLVNDFCTKLEIPLISGSVFKAEGQLGFFTHPHKGPNYRSLFPEPPDPEENPPCSISGINPSYPAQIAIKMAQVALEFLTKKHSFMENCYEKHTFDKGRIERVDIQGLEPVLPTDPIFLDERMKKGVVQISPAELKDWLDEGKEVLLVDVREAEEIQICSLDAVHVPMIQIESKAAELKKSNHIPKVVYCHHGIRSTMVIQILTERFGVKNLYNLTGGIDAWAQLVDPSMPRY